MAAIICFATATIVEIAGYYIPFVDNILDTITTPDLWQQERCLTSAILPDIDPMVKWGLGIIVGGGSAGIIQSGTVILHKSNINGNNSWCSKPNIVATVEHLFAIVGKYF